jgi:hypothetical protein
MWHTSCELLSTALSLAFVLLILDQNRRTFRYGCVVLPTNLDSQGLSF